MSAAIPVLVLGVLSSSPSHAESVSVVASERYEKGLLHTIALGRGYREAWGTEVELPVLDLATEGGGLKPTRRYGGIQTAVLGFKGKDGGDYTFRAADKNPSALLSPQLKGTLIEAFVQDQMSAQHPAAPLVADHISASTGVSAVQKKLVVMPDDPALGAFQKEFAGMVGTFFAYPQSQSDDHPGFRGAQEIIGEADLYDRLRADSTMRINTRAFLRARLVDLVLGDFDRHRKQWRWVRYPDDDAWHPLPEDRDMAFVRYDGAGMRIASVYVPILQRYGPDYPPIQGLTLHGWEQDRWLLTGLERPEWERIARDVQRLLTDEVITDAVAKLPDEYVAIDAERLTKALRGRRDGLPEAAEKFYLHLARRVDIQTSDAADAVLIEHQRDHSTRVTVTAIVDADTDAPALPHFERLFHPDETAELRLHLRDGDDIVSIHGKHRGILVRLIAKRGAKQIDDRENGRAIIYDENGESDVQRGRRTGLRTTPYEPPESRPTFADVEDIPPRDWGTDVVPLPSFGYERDMGMLLGSGASLTRYGFRKHPWASRHLMTGQWATRARQPRVRYAGALRPENSAHVVHIDAHFSGLEMLRYYGTGNETNADLNEDAYRVENQQLAFSPTLSIPLTDPLLRLSFGPAIAYSRTQDGEYLVNQENPYGSGQFGMIGIVTALQIDRRTTLTSSALELALPFHNNLAAGYPTGGYIFDLRASVSPEAWDVEKLWGDIEATFASYWSYGDNARATFGFRFGGKQTFGKVPYFRQAHIGGQEFHGGKITVRGYRAQRFSGDASVFANLDLRLYVTRLKLIVPGDLGILGFGDIGRVFTTDEASDKWHPSGGAGIWFAPLLRTNTISFAVSRSREDTLFSLRFGFHY